MDNIFYGAVIVLRHEESPAFLFSDELHYTHPGCTDQQMVACVSDETSNCHWLVKPGHGIDPALLAGMPIKPGDVIRLEHVPTRRNLHTHADHFAPTNRDQTEVTCYGENGIGNGDDNWIVELPGGGLIWLADQRVRLVNQSIGAALHSHGATFVLGTTTFQEVTGHPKGRRDENDYWFASIRTASTQSLLAKNRRSNLNDWAKDWLSIIASVCSITGVTLLGLHEVVSAITFERVITFGLASMSALGVMLLAVGCVSTLRKYLSALGNHVVWASRVLAWIFAFIAGWITWLAIVQLVRVLLEETVKVVK
jgi:hypothetical protein